MILERQNVNGAWLVLQMMNLGGVSKKKKLLNLFRLFMNKTDYIL